MLSRNMLKSLQPLFRSQISQATYSIVHINEQDRMESLNREHIFSSDRSRDHYSSISLIQYEPDLNESNRELDQNIDSYDCQGTVSLSSHMQTNVPEPFRVVGKAPTNLNMPNGGSSLLHKHISSHRVDLCKDSSF